MVEKTNGGATPPAATTEKLTKTEAVKRSLAKLGKSALPKAIQADIKERFGMDVAADYAGKVKTELLGKGKKAARPTGKEPATQALKSEPSPGKREGRQAVELNDILELKRLVDRVGAEDLKTLIEVIGE